MKKMILPALCLSLCLTSVSISALNVSSNPENVVSILNDDRQVIKSEELPEAVRKTLSTDAYKGWTVKEAAVIKTQVVVTKETTEKATPASYYEVVLTNEKETKTVKFQQDGTLLN